MSISSEPLTASTLSCPVLASARTTNVLPQPGGPYSSTPRGGSTPSREKVSGCCNGHSTASVSACLASAMSPTSSSVTLPTVISSLAERDSGRITVSAPTRSSWLSCRWLAVGAGPRRRAQRRLAHQRGQVGDHETRCAAGDLVEIEVVGGHRLEQRLQQRLAGGGVGQAAGPARGRTGPGRAAGDRAGRARAEVAINATPAAATAVRSSARISAATGSAVAGSSASTSAISSTPPPSRTPLSPPRPRPCSRSSAASAPTSGPSSSTSLRPAHTARTSVTLPTPAGPDTSTPRLVAAPRVLQQVRFVERELEPFGELGGLRLRALELLDLDPGACRGDSAVRRGTRIAAPAGDCRCPR